ncbi:MAG: phospho-N-acetylmuramoyl-pentapeptide-transferase [Alphaproteobacteria bacterium]
MLYNLLYPLNSQYTFLNIFKYITVRAAGATLTALIIVFCFGPAFIRKLKALQGKGQPIRKEGPASHLTTKQGTPTMGGSLILLGMTVSTLLWADLTNSYVWIVLGVTLSLGVLGGIDDYIKVTKQYPDGMRSRTKFAIQILIGCVATYFILHHSPLTLENQLFFPFFKNALWNMGGWFFLFSTLVIVGSSNAVNLTDGLDGLAIGPIIFTALSFAVITYIVGNSVFAHYLQLHFVPGSGELAIICGAFVGASLGFLWFNAPPAMIFMGDMGSLAIGGALGAISLIVKHEIVLAIIGGIFVLEAVSVMLQVAYFKMTGGKRIFLMAPLHHHFEKKGWAESTVVIRFWIISIILALIGLATLKIR